MVRVGDPLIAIGGSRRCLTRTRGKILLILTVICSGLLYLSYDRLVSVKKPPHMRSRRSEKVVIPAAEPLLFPADYHARGVLSLPYGDIVEPFEVWHSATRNMSRIDYYGGMDRTYQRQDLGQYGFACKVVPEFSEKEHKTFKGCLHRRGTARFPVKTQSIVPSPSYFKYGGETEYKGSLHSKWEHSFTIYNKLNSYTLLTTKTRPAKPVRYEMTGYDTLLSSYYDHYILEYDVFEPWSFRYSNFQIPTNLRCFDFTSHRLAGAVGDINPMVEFMPHAESGAPYTLSHPSNHRNTPTSPSYSTTRPSVRPQNALEYLLEKLNQLPLVEEVATKKPTFAPYSARRTKSSQGQTSYRKKTAYKEKMRHYEDILNTLFDSFKGDFKKTYHTKHEHERRKNIYRHNIRFIKSRNRQHLGYTLKPNHLTDMTEKEVEREKGLLKANHEALIGGAMFHVPLGDENRDPPETLDWRQRGAVNPVHSQGICGSCYAFAVTGAVEGAHFLKTGELLNLSEQQIIDCTWGFGNRGCKGGYPYRALQWIVKHGGLATEDSYGRYLAQEGYCHFKNTTIGAQMETFMKVTRMNTTEMKMALTFYGPVSILINTQPKSFKFYGSGVYYDPQCSHAYDHAALAVGYGVEKGVPYWLVKNSWSKIWGDQGYIKIAQKNDNCGVTQKAVAVKIKT